MQTGGESDAFLKARSVKSKHEPFNRGGGLARGRPRTSFCFAGGATVFYVPDMGNALLRATKNPRPSNARFSVPKPGAKKRHEHEPTKTHCNFNLVYDQKKTYPPRQGRSSLELLPPTNLFRGFAFFYALAVCSAC